MTRLIYPRSVDRAGRVENRGLVGIFRRILLPFCCDAISQCGCKCTLLSFVLIFPKLSISQASLS